MTKQPEIAGGVIIRDLLILHVKLFFDGLKDVVLAPVSVGAAVLDLLRGPSAEGYRIYRVMRMGERFDLWLNLYGAAREAEASGEGLFAGSEPGDGTLLGSIEGLSTGERIR